MQETFVWTEVFNCGELGAVCLESYLAHHSLPVHVYGFREDLSQIADHPLIAKICPESGLSGACRHFLWTKLGLGHPTLTEKALRSGFACGHLGTARLWAHLIQSRTEPHMVHFDSDIVFLGSIVNDIVDRLKHFSIVGPVRNYKNNPCNRPDVTHLADLSQTCCFGFDRRKIDMHGAKELILMCQGAYNPKGHPVIDFFDPVMFEILGNAGTIAFLPHDEVGGCDLAGSRDNAYAALNNFPTPFKIDFGSKIMHFSAVGSGCNAYHNRNVNIPQQYRQYAIDRYALYSKSLLDKDIGVDLKDYSILLEHLEKIDKENWTYHP